MQKILMQKSLLDEKTLRSILALHWKYPVFASVPKAMPIGLQLPVTLARHVGVAPVRFLPGEEKLLTGFVHSIDYSVLLAIEKMTGYRAKPCFITASDFEKSIGLCAPARAKELVMQAALDARRMARAVCEHGARLNASRVRLVRCNGLLWVRLNTLEDVMDIFFTQTEAPRETNSLSSASHAASDLAA